MNNPGDIVFGNQSKAGDNFGGIQNVGGFQTVASSLNNVGHTELAKALSDLVSAIETSPEFDPVQKKETIAVLGELGEEVAKNEPSKTKISVLWSGLQPVLSTAADVVKVAATVGTILGALLP